MPVIVSFVGKWDGKDLAKAQSEIGKMQAQLDTFSNKMKASGEKTKAFGQGMSKVGKNLTVGLTLPLVGVGAAATKMAMDFDTSLTKMVSLVGLTRDEVDGMRTQITDLASQYGKSAAEAADAMFFITSAGLRGADAMETLEASLKGAAIGLGDVITIADLSTSAMNAYGPSVLSATKATSILRTAVEQGKLESTELAASMGSVLPVASAMGVGFDEAAAAMAAMSRTGTNAAEASTQLRGIMSQLAKETPKGRKALASVGLSYEGLRKQIKDEGLLATLQTLVTAFDGNTVATSAFFGNVRALTGVMDLFGSGAETTKEIFGALAATTADDLNPALEAASETTGFKLQQAFATLKNSLVGIGDIIAPFVAQVAERLAALGRAFADLSPQMKAVAVAVGVVLAAIGPLLLIVGKGIVLFGQVKIALAGVTAAGALLAVKVVAVVAAVAAIAVAFKLVYDRSESLRNAVGTLIATVQKIAQVLIGQVSAAFKRITGDSEGFGNIIDKITDVLGVVFTGAVTVVTNVLKVLGGAFQVAIKIVEVGIKIFGMVANVIRGALLAAIDILFNKLGPVSTALRALANGVRSAFNSVTSFVKNAFSNVGKFVEDFINFGIRAVNALIEAYNKLADFLPGVSRASLIAEFRFQSMSASTEAAASSANNLANQIGGYASQVLRGNKATDAAYNSNMQLGDSLNDLDEDLDLDTDKTEKNASAKEKAAEKLKKYNDMFKEHAETLKKAREEIQANYEGMAKAVQNAVLGSIDFSDALPEVDEQGNRVGQTFMEKLNAQAEKAKEFAAKIKQLIQEGLSPEAITMVVQEGINAGTKIADELINGGATAIDDTNRLVESTTNAATEIGLFAADTYYGTGLALAKETEDAFAARWGEGGPGYGKLNRLMNTLANSLNRTATITVVTKHVTEDVPGRRMGGPVAAGSPYIVGEAGPELFVPTVTGRIIPNHDLSKSVGSGSVAVGGGSSVVTINVNAGMGTDGAEVGRQVVEALKQYERRNGAIPVKVAS